MAQQVKGLSKHDDLSPILGSHRVKGENQILPNCPDRHEHYGTSTCHTHIFFNIRA